MENSGFLLIFVIIFLLIVVVTLIFGLFYLFTQLRSSETKNNTISKDYEEKLQTVLLKHQKEIIKARQESVSISRNTIKGQIAEQMAPILKGFPYLPSDSHFIGMPIDYLIFRGYTDLKDSHKINDDFEIVLADIKYNKAVLSVTQEAIKRAIQQGKVKFETIRILEDGNVKVDSWGIDKDVMPSIAINDSDLENTTTIDQRDTMLRILRKYPNAYKPWKTDDDNLLKEKFESGLNLKELSILFQRQPSAIRSRIRKKQWVR